jgi:hypothetical protein
MADPCDRIQTRLPMSGSGNLEEELPARARIISPSVLLSGEVVIFELKPSLWYAAFISGPFLVGAVLLGAFSFASDVLPPSVRHAAMIFSIWVAGIGVAAGMLLWLGRTYVLTDRRVLKQRGVFNVRVDFMGLEEVQNSFVAQSPFHRAVGIGTLFFRSGPDGGRRASHTWEHVRRPQEVHAEVVRQIDRWKQTRPKHGAGGNGD